MDEFTPQDVARHMSALQDSVNLIDAIIEANDRSEDQADAMDRNVRHILIMCAKPHLNGNDLTPYTDAAARGNAWLAQN